ncbi:hypothetical protein [Comamonas sp.]|uniref:hypothetical protein n=1 Tax=Comamonas sp. TaxID=34028 RepID=UPI00258BEADF|nr:hypothetical protein [Comamonas sp.]
MQQLILGLRQPQAATGLALLQASGQGERSNDLQPKVLRLFQFQLQRGTQHMFKLWVEIKVNPHTTRKTSASTGIFLGAPSIEPDGIRDKCGLRDS